MTMTTIPCKCVLEMAMTEKMDSNEEEEEGSIEFLDKKSLKE
jgi:hypothetical protein